MNLDIELIILLLFFFQLTIVPTETKYFVAQALTDIPLSKSCTKPSLLMFFDILFLPIHGSSLSSLRATLEYVTTTVRQNQNELWNDRCTHRMIHAGVQCDEDYFSGVFRNLCSMFKVMGFILRMCINMVKIIVCHKMFNVRRGSFRTSVQSDSFHYIQICKNLQFVMIDCVQVTHCRNNGFAPYDKFQHSNQCQAILKMRDRYPPAMKLSI